MKIKPAGDHVLIKVIEEDEGSIVLLNKEKPQYGIVVDVAKKVNKVSPGMKVSFARYAGTEIVLDNELHLLMPIRDVLTYE